MEARLKSIFGFRDALPRPGLGLAARICILSAVFFLEKSLCSAFFDSERALSAEGFGAWAYVAQHWVFRFVVATMAAVSLFTWVQGREKLKSVEAAVRSSRLRIGWAFLHFALAACLIPPTYFLYRDEAPAPFLVILVLWIGLATAAVMSAAAAMAPRRVWWQAAVSLKDFWGYSLMAGAISVCAMDLSQRLWSSTATLTFMLVRRLLLPVLPNLLADPVAHTLRTPRFAIAVANACSGLEGAGLILSFCAAWLIYYRREYIFPQALLLIPAGIAAIFAVNVVRIAILVLIGDAGYGDVAIYGFHSQAGWIAFISVAWGLILLSRRVAWIYRIPARSEVDVPTDNPTATYLMPLLSILAAGSLARAISGSFEYFYPLRVVAGFAALAFLWRKLAAIDWRWSWRGPAVGAAVFVVWLIAAKILLPASAMPERLAAMSPLLRSGWILSRILGSVVSVPIAEELAYRGYLMRRLSDADFESVPYSSVKWISLAAGSVLFGVAHGAMWIAGVVAGAAYGLLVMRSGRLGEAVAAHATTNGLIAATVLATREWQLW